MNKINIDLETFKVKYISENLTIPECAKFFKCSKNTIVRFCKKNNITKSLSLINANISKSKENLDIFDRVLELHNLGLCQAQIMAKLKISYKMVAKFYKTKQIKPNKKQAKTKIKENKKIKSFLWDDRCWFLHQYIELNKSIQQMSEEFGVCTLTLLKRKKLFDIKKPKNLRRQHPAFKNSPIKNRDYLYDQYITQNKRLEEIAKQENVSEWLVAQSIKKFNIVKSKLLRRQNTRQSKLGKGLIFQIEGLSTHQISEKTGLSHSYICKIIKEIKPEKISQIIEYSKSIKRQNRLEKLFQESFGVEFFNKKLLGINHRPDFIVNEDLYCNTDGLYWHSEKILEDRWQHVRHREKFEKQGKRLLQFREDEVYDKPEIIRSMIDNHRGHFTKIYARKCKVENVSQKHAEQFLASNHLMGSTFAKFYGLYYNKELVCLLGFKKNKDGLKVERFCNKNGTKVVGGFSKLLSHVLKDNQCNYVDYWVDLRYGTGEYLKNLGFQHIKDTLGWKWTDFRNTYNRLYCRANMDERKLTQKQHSEELGLVKIYDAGQRMYRKYLNKTEQP